MYYLLLFAKKWAKENEQEAIIDIVYIEISEIRKMFSHDKLSCRSIYLCICDRSKGTYKGRRDLTAVD